MIRYALICDGAHEFEAWFADSAAYDDQSARGLVTCPQCDSVGVRKQVMAPAVAGARKGAPADPHAAFQAFAAAVRAHISSTHEHVGERFVEEARAMHRGEVEERPIYGEASPEDAKALRDEGAPVAPLPEPFAPKPPKKLN